MSGKDYKKLALAAVRGEVPAVVLKERQGDCGVWRVKNCLDFPVIMKVWNRPGWKGVIRRLTRTTPGYKEFRGLSTLRKIGVSAPEPLIRIDLGSELYSEVLFQEDLGPCVTGIRHVKNLVSSAEEAKLDIFLDEVVDMTRRLFDAGILDTDHTLYNIVARRNGRAARLDAELAHRSGRGLTDQDSGLMLGRLIGTYAFAAQPDVGRITAFAGQLHKALQLSRNALEAAEIVTDAMMDVQRRRYNVETKIIYPWR